MPNQPITTEDIQRTLEICEKATEDPWINTDGLVCGIESNPDCGLGGPSFDIYDASEWPSSHEREAYGNADFLAHARTALPAYCREILRLRELLEFFTKHYHCRECKVPWSPELHDAICSEDGDSYSEHPTRHDWYSKRERKMCDKMLAAEQDALRLKELLGEYPPGHKPGCQSRCEVYTHENMTEYGECDCGLTAKLAELGLKGETR